MIIDDVDMFVELRIDKAAVLDEVARTTAYLAAKKQGDKSAIERIAVVETDKAMLERFWQETCGAMTDLLKRFIVRVTSDGDYVAGLEMSGAWNPELSGSVTQSLSAYAVSSMVSKWCKLAERDDEARYAQDASSMLLDAKDKLWYRRRPLRPLSRHSSS